jgi:hypothetical protein
LIVSGLIVMVVRHVVVDGHVGSAVVCLIVAAVFLPSEGAGGSSSSPSTAAAMPTAVPAAVGIAREKTARMPDAGLVCVSHQGNPALESSTMRYSSESLRVVVAEHMQLRPRSIAFCLTQINRVDPEDLKLVTEDAAAVLQEATSLADLEIRVVAALPALEALPAGRRDDLALRAFEQFEAGVIDLAQQGREAILGEIADRLLDRLDVAIGERTQQLREQTDGLHGSPIADLAACLEQWTRDAKAAVNGARGTALSAADAEVAGNERSLRDKLETALLGPRSMADTILNLERTVPGLLADFGTRVEAAFLRRFDEPLGAAFVQAAADLPERIRHMVNSGSEYTGRAVARAGPGAVWPGRSRRYPP